MILNFKTNTKTYFQLQLHTEHHAQALAGHLPMETSINILSFFKLNKTPVTMIMWK